jgi:hypothetical protein
MKKSETDLASFIKIVYFDEESASDYLDISAGGKEESSSEKIKERTNAAHGKVESSLAAKLSWLPFFGVSGSANMDAEISAAGRSIISKTLSNTILTDYLEKSTEDKKITKLKGINLSAKENSMAYMKMFTPYMIMLNMEDSPIDLAKMDEVLSAAKGYYELVGNDLENKDKYILRFNINAFRNNYGLTDLSRMHLVFHGILVGKTTEKALSMEAEMTHKTEADSVKAADIIDTDSHPTAKDDNLLNVYDIILAGVESGFDKIKER